MLDDNVGYNISPSSWDKYPSIGRGGTFVSDNKSVSDVIGNIDGKSSTTISPAKAAELEKSMGLQSGSLKKGFKLRKVENITGKMPRSPLEGNEYFLGPGKHLPGGAPEMVIESIPTKNTADVTTVLEVFVK